MPKKRPPSHRARATFASDLKGDAELATTLMGRQLRLAISIAAWFLLLILGMPLLNAFWPSAMQKRVIGFPASWLLVGVLAYPVTWALAWYFVVRSEWLEVDDARLVRERRSHRE